MLLGRITKHVKDQNWFAVGMLRALLAALILSVLAFTGFVISVEHPATRGPVRCWLQETFYQQDWTDAPQGTPVIEAKVTTAPVRDMCDAADDPAIWVSDQAPGGALVLGTNKLASINVYDLSGSLVSQADKIGAPNNVDVRGNDGRVFVMASDKDDAEIEAFFLDVRSGSLSPIPGAPFPAVLEEEVYGFCLYRASATLYAFTTDKSGLIVQYAVDLSGSNATTTKARELRVASQPEGCVVDDDAGYLFVGEEDVGIWRFDADPEASVDGALIAKAGENGPLTADVEGLALYDAADGGGYLIASSQGDNTYVVFDRAMPHAFRGRFQVSYEGQIIGDTDGLEVTSKSIGSDYPHGLLVVQDGFIRDNSGARRNQRFAYVSWSDVERALDL